MIRGSFLRGKMGRTALGCFVAVLGVWLFFAGGARSPGASAAAEPRLVSVQPLSAMAGAACEWIPAALAAAVPTAADRAPTRVIHDPYATFSAVAVDPARDEIVVQDETLFQVLVYDRLANTPPTAAMTEPKRRIGGSRTKVEFNCALHIDPRSGDIYSVNNDVVDTMVVFSRKAEGNVPPDRELKTPHRTFGLAVDDERQELFLTVQHPPAVVVYRKTASGDETPLRILEGPRTQLEDPHGIAVDTKGRWMFVSNHGSVSYSREDGVFRRSLTAARASAVRSWAIPKAFETESAMIPGSGRYEPPSITVYDLDASGDTPPLRVIEGARTQLNWPSGIYLDQEHGELLVANDVGDSVLVFRGTDQGNAVPLRVLKGPGTGLKNPTSVFVDVRNDELVVANMGNHSATVYRRAAEGNAAPLRTIRAAPRGKQALIIGNPGAVAYDTKRGEILVPN